MKRNDKPDLPRRAAREREGDTAMRNLPIQENVVDPICRMLDTQDLDTVAEWIQNPDWDDLKLLMQPEYDNVIFAYAYLHGLADAFDMTMLEVFTEWRSMQ